MIYKGLGIKVAPLVFPNGTLDTVGWKILEESFQIERNLYPAELRNVRMELKCFQIFRVSKCKSYTSFFRKMLVDMLFEDNIIIQGKGRHSTQ